MDYAKLNLDIAAYATSQLFEPVIGADEELLRFFQCKKLALEGMISAAKTTTGHNIATFAQDRGFAAKFYEETVNSELLTNYYAAVARGDKPNSTAHELQMDTLSRCKASWQAANIFAQTGFAILDRSRWGNAIFGAMHRAYGNVTDEQYEDYCHVLKTGTYAIDHIVYLDVDPIVAHHRALNIRSKPEEKELQLQYLYDLERASFLHVYHQLASGVSNIVILRNDVFRTAQEVLELVRDAPRKPYNISDVDVAAALEDPTKIRSFFVYAGEYYARGH